MARFTRRENNLPTAESVLRLFAEGEFVLFEQFGGLVVRDSVQVQLCRYDGGAWANEQLDGDVYG